MLDICETAQGDREFIAAAPLRYLLAGLLDDSHWLEVGAGHGESLLTAWAYLGGFAVGVVPLKSRPRGSP